MPDSSKFLQFVPHQIDVLVSAYRVSRFKHVKEFLDLSRRLFLDSGFFSAGMKGEIEWLNNNQYLFDLADEIKPDYIAAIDFPISSSGGRTSELLKLAKMTSLEAIEKTIENAGKLLDYETNAIKVLPIQGCDLMEYEYCVSLYDRELNAFSLNSERYMFGLGGISIGNDSNMGSREEILQSKFEFVKFIRKLVPKEYEIHSFGIGNLQQLQMNHSVGVSSSDSSVSSLNVALHKSPYCRTKKRTFEQVNFQFAAEFLRYGDYINKEINSFVVPEKGYKFSRNNDQLDLFDWEKVL